MQQPEHTAQQYSCSAILIVLYYVYSVISMASSLSPYAKLSTYDKTSGNITVVIETPKGSRNKFKYDENTGLFALGGVLPEGAVFPYDFGFIPRTRGGDGDPLDILLLMDEPVFTGCLVQARLIGVIKAHQKEADKEEVENHRLLAVSSETHSYQSIQKTADLDSSLLDELEHFFISYNEIKGKEFCPIGRFGPDSAQHIVSKGELLFKKAKKTKRSSSSKKRGKQTT